MHTVRIPPVDPATATITAVLAMHAGHICPSSELLIRPRLSALPVSSLRENKTFGVHLPMKMNEATFDSCVVFMPPCLLRKRDLTARICLSRLCFAVGTFPACQCRGSRAIRNMHVPRRVGVRFELETEPHQSPAVAVAVKNIPATATMAPIARATCLPFG